MSKKNTIIAAVAGLAIGGGALLAVPALAETATSTPSATASQGVGEGRKDVVTKIRESLQGLVSDKTITAEQADKVAQHMAQNGPRGGHGGKGGRGHGGPGGVMGSKDDAAAIVGMSADELHTALHSGKTLAAIAQEKGINKDDLIAKLEAKAKENLAAAVKDGKLTQARADEISKDLKARITDMVDRTRPAKGEGPGKGRGEGNGGRGGHRGGMHGPGMQGGGQQGGEGATTAPSSYQG